MIHPILSSAKLKNGVMDAIVGNKYNHPSTPHKDDASHALPHRANSAPERSVEAMHHDGRGFYSEEDMRHKAAPNKNVFGTLKRIATPKRATKIVALAALTAGFGAIPLAAAGVYTVMDKMGENAHNKAKKEADQKKDKAAEHIGPRTRDSIEAERAEEAHIDRLQERIVNRPKSV